MERMQRYDHYKVLGLPRTASRDEVKKAFRLLAKRCHPDRDPSPRAAEIFRAVYEAYEVLMDPARRYHFDQELERYRTSSVARAKHGPTAAPSHAAAPDPPGPWDLFAYRGLHFTGLLFGISLTSVVLLGTLFFDLPWFTIGLVGIGVGILPDSVAGLRKGPTQHRTPQRASHRGVQ